MALFFALSLFLSIAHGDFKPLNQGLEKANLIGHLEHIKGGKKTIEIQRDSSSYTLKRGDEIFVGDMISTQNETIYIRIVRNNEIQITPHSTVSFETFEDGEDKQPVIFLQKGIIWGLIVNGVSLAYPYYVKTNNAAAALTGTNFVAESIPEAKKSTFLSLEGNMKYTKSMEGFSNPAKISYLNSGLRVHINGDEQGKAKKFKKNLLIGYLNRNAKETAEDMVQRGTRLLASISKKDTVSATEEELTWNNVVGGSGSSGGGFGSFHNMPTSGDPSMSGGGSGASNPNTMSQPSFGSGGASSPISP